MIIMAARRLVCGMVPVGSPHLFNLSQFDARHGNIDLGEHFRKTSLLLFAKYSLISIRYNIGSIM